MSQIISLANFNVPLATAAPRNNAFSRARAGFVKMAWYVAVRLKTTGCCCIYCGIEGISNELSKAV
jgi:hypothetical protein